MTLMSLRGAKVVRRVWKRVEDGGDTDSASDFLVLVLDNDPAVNTPTPGTRPVAGTYLDVAIHDVQGITDLADGTLVGVAGAADESPLLDEAVRI